MKHIIILLLFSEIMLAQVSNVQRNKESYTQDVFPYKGVRAIQIDEVNFVDKEDNVFIFSKIEKNAKPDKMYLQRFTKEQSGWILKSLIEINHDGIISAWGSRKAFADYDSDHSIDALFIYGLYDANFKQQSVHLIYSTKAQFYTVEASVLDGFKQNKFSANFNDLEKSVKNKILEYWNKLDKEDQS